MLSLDQFREGYEAVENTYTRYSEVISWMKAPEVERAYSIYLQAYDTINGFLVMGRTCVDEEGRNPAQFGNAIDMVEHQNLGVITHMDEARVINQGRMITGVQAGGGAIMHYYAAFGGAGYHFLYNDSWLLGGAHGLQNFHLASPRWHTNLWTGERVTVTGRELVALTSHGYSIQQAPIGEILTSAGNEDQARAMSLQSMLDAYAQADSYGSIEHLVSVMTVDDRKGLLKLNGLTNQ